MTRDLVLLSVNPRSVARATRIEYACQLLRSGYTVTEVSVALRKRYAISHAGAWRDSRMAWDLAGAP